MILRLFGLFVERKEGVALERRFGENRRAFACSLIAAKSNGVRRLEERTGLDKENSNLSLD